MNKRHLKIAFYNCNGIIKKEGNILRFIKKEKIDIMFFAETWLDPTNIKKLNLQNVFCNLHEEKPSNGHAPAGILGIRSSNLHGNIRSVEIDPKKKWCIYKCDSTFLCCCYFPPGYDIREIDNFIQRIKHHSDHGAKQCFVFGDFNIRLGDLTGDTASDTTQRTTLLTEFAEEMNWTLLTPNEGKWTTITSNGRGIPDHVFCSAASARHVWNYTVFENSLIESDHRPLVVTFGLERSLPKSTFDRWDIAKLKREECLTEYTRLIRETAPEVNSKLLSTLTEINSQLGERITVEEARELVEKSTSEVLFMLNTAMHSACGKFRYRDHLNWNYFDEEMERVYDAAEDSYQEAINAHTLEHKRTKWKEFKLRMHHYRLLATKKKRKYLDKLADCFTERHNKTRFPKMMSMLKKRESRTNCMLEPEHMDVYRSHFGSTFGLAPTGHAEEINFETLAASSSNTIKVIEESAPIDIETVKRILKFLPSGKTPGKDGIFNEMLKFVFEDIAPCIATLFKYIAILDEIPELWKQALIVPVYKNKGDPLDVKNYRPIALTSCLRRAFEKVIALQLAPADEFLDTAQGGFRQHRSTLDQIAMLQEICIQHPEAYHAFLDIQAAYDCVDRRILWTRLVVHSKVHLKLLRTIRALFDFNKSILVINGQESVPIKNLRGLLQGSSLSPILFNHFINDLILKLNAEQKMSTHNVETNCLFFADDAALHALAPETLQQLLDVCTEWAKRNGIRFAPAKCVVLSKQQGEAFKMQNEEIPHNDKFKYLGVTFDTDGINWRKSIEPRVQTMRTVCKWLAGSGMFLNGWRPESNLMLYKMFLRPLMEYGTPVDTLPTKQIESMQKAQNEALRTVFSAAFNTSIGALHSLPAIPPVKTRLQELNGKYFSRIVNRTQSTLIGQVAANTRNSDDPSCFWNRLASNPIWSSSETEFKINSKVLFSRRHRAITSYRRHANGIAAAISVSPNCKPNPLLKANWLDRKIQKTLIQWRLGRVAFHQECGRCFDEMSRKHAIRCAGLHRVIRRDFPGLIVYNSEANQIDQLLERIPCKEENKDKLEKIASYIEEIRIKCLGWRRNPAGELIRPEDVERLRIHPVTEYDVP